MFQTSTKVLAPDFFFSICSHDNQENWKASTRIKPFLFYLSYIAPLYSYQMRRSQSHRKKMSQALRSMIVQFPIAITQIDNIANILLSSMLYRESSYTLSKCRESIAYFARTQNVYFDRKCNRCPCFLAFLIRLRFFITIHFLAICFQSHFSRQCC